MRVSAMCFVAYNCRDQLQMLMLIVTMSDVRMVTRALRLCLPRCSFVQIYREQVYDLLNPASLTPGQQQQRGLAGGAGAGAAGVGGPLKLRWSKAEEFYLENLFMVGRGGWGDCVLGMGQRARRRVWSG